MKFGLRKSKVVTTGLSKGLIGFSVDDLGFRVASSVELSSARCPAP